MARLRDIIHILEEAETILLEWGERETRWIPPTDLFVTQGYVWVTFEIPGVSENDLSISVSPTMVYIQGVRKAPEEFRQGVTFYNLEIPYGAFERRVILPCPIDPTNLQFKFERGILTLRLTKKEKRVKILEIK